MQEENLAEIALQNGLAGFGVGCMHRLPSDTFAEVYHRLATRTAAAGGGDGVGYTQLLGWLGGGSSRVPDQVLEQVRVGQYRI
eukprot:SAG31_NODE_880_length_11279_cov_154.463238_4_plen_83_part_00